MQKFLKCAAIVLAVLVVLPFVVAAFMPRTFELDREVVIDKPNDEVFDYVRRMENQKNYAAWFRIDPNIKTKMAGEDGKVGAVFSWESADQNVGVGELEIRSIEEGKRIDYEIRIKEPFQSADPTSTLTERVGEKQTKVHTVYHGQMPYPMNLLCPVVCQKIGDDMQASLAQLKQVLEHPGSGKP